MTLLPLFKAPCYTPNNYVFVSLLKNAFKLTGSLKEEEVDWRGGRLYVVEWWVGQDH